MIKKLARHHTARMIVKETFLSLYTENSNNHLPFPSKHSTERTAQIFIVPFGWFSSRAGILIIRCLDYSVEPREERNPGFEIT